MGIIIKQMHDENGVPFFPMTSISSVRDEDGNSILDYINNAGVFTTAQTIEDGVFFVDESLTIGASIDVTGVHANNILKYQIIDF